MKKIGITETYDPHFISDWDNNLKDINIIITKNLSDKMINKLINNQDKCLLHLTCTGNGGNVYEPNVPPLNETVGQFNKLLERGFPLKKCVLRIDPIIPNEIGFTNLVMVLESFKKFTVPFNNMLRCRISMMDYYPHVQERFKKSNVSLSWKSFHSPKVNFERVDGLLIGYTDSFNFESCAESMFNDIIVEKSGCVSEKDIKIMGEDINDYSSKGHCNRNGCSCITKTNILKIKPSQCPHKCLYCYWKVDYATGE